MENNKYNNSKIYKIEPICEYPEGDIYIGVQLKNIYLKGWYNIDMITSNGWIIIKNVVNPLICLINMV